MDRNLPEFIRPLFDSKQEAVCAALRPHGAEENAGTAFIAVCVELLEPFHKQVCCFLPVKINPVICFLLKVCRECFQKALVIVGENIFVPDAGGETETDTRLLISVDLCLTDCLHVRIKRHAAVIVVQGRDAVPNVADRIHGGCCLRF